MRGLFEMVDGRELRYADIVSASPFADSFVPAVRGARKRFLRTLVNASGHRSAGPGAPQEGR
jgi:hypothetical protein